MTGRAMPAARCSSFLTLPLLLVSPAALALSDAGLRHTGAVAATAGYLAFCLLIWQRHRRRQERQREAAAALLGKTGDDDPLLIVYASQTGGAERLAWQSAEMLRQADIPIRLLPLASLQPHLLGESRRALFVISTYGEGDPPDGAAPFARRLMQQPLDLHQLRFGLLALGDSSYPHYCGFGRAIGHWLRASGAAALFDPVEVDNGDGAALRHWQHQLALLGGGAVETDWNSPRYQRWRLVERRCLNPGSAGAPAFLIALEPLDGTADWQAGDIAEVGVPASVTADTPLIHREYSIASLPTSGRVELLVRQVRRADGSLGLGSGYLTATAPVGGEIAVSLRRNSNFHSPPAARPLILIGNGTGIAGLRAHLLAREQAGRGDNWLLFGERNRGHDYFFGEVLERWRECGHLTRLDLAFSRDDSPAYVQQRLDEAGPEICHWVERGAAIYVCGSLQGMAPAVHAVLTELLGETALEQLTEAGRYRRDVY